MSIRQGMQWRNRSVSILHILQHTQYVAPNMVHPPRTLSRNLAHRSLSHVGLDGRRLLFAQSRNVQHEDGPTSPLCRRDASRLGKWRRRCQRDNQCHRAESRKWIRNVPGGIDRCGNVCRDGRGGSRDCDCRWSEVQGRARQRCLHVYSHFGHCLWGVCRWGGGSSRHTDLFDLVCGLCARGLDCRYLPSGRCFATIGIGETE
mmetsp:Transcript_12809/g.18252  ORF Transcript_12809/g.18252 Transcript_12809/m.18252 type:complete len:203 (-) Transcript_12809:1804-2412(-)